MSFLPQHYKTFPWLFVQFHRSQLPNNKLHILKHPNLIFRFLFSDFPVTGICQAVLTAGEAARYTYENDENTTAVLSCHIWEAPHIANTDGTARAYQNKSQSGQKIFSIHTSIFPK